MASAPWDINGRVALVTGAASGIGLDTARRLAARGMGVALVDVDGELVEREAAAIGADRAIGLRADVTDREALDRTVGEAISHLGSLDVVIANAGVSAPLASLRTIDPEDFARTVAIDLHGVWNTVRAGLGPVVERRGYVLVVASLYAAMNGVLHSPYAIAKAGVEQLGRALRVELAPHGAAAGVAYFGFIDTPMVREAFSRPVAETLRATFPAWLSRPVPVGRAGAAMAAGVERRAARVSAPRWVPWVLAARGLIGPLDRRLARDPGVAAAIAQAEAGARAEVEGGEAQSGLAATPAER